MHSLDIDRASSLCLSPPPGKMAGIFGDGATGLVLRTLARPLLRGETVVAVDGGNRFDPYEIGKAAKALEATVRWPSPGSASPAAFTCDQMEALLSRRLPGALSRVDARLALIMGLPERSPTPTCRTRKHAGSSGTASPRSGGCPLRDAGRPRRAGRTTDKEPPFRGTCPR